MANPFRFPLIHQTQSLSVQCQEHYSNRHYFDTQARPLIKWHLFLDCLHSYQLMLNLIIKLQFLHPAIKDLFA